jgi:hypothetical protein
VNYQAGVTRMVIKEVSTVKLHLGPIPKLNLCHLHFLVTGSH